MREFGYYILFGACRNERNHCETTKDNGTYFQEHNLQLRWPNTVCARFTDSVSDAIEHALGLWYANMAVGKVIPQFHMKWIIKLSFDPK